MVRMALGDTLLDALDFILVPLPNEGVHLLLRDEQIFHLAKLIDSTRDDEMIGQSSERKDMREWTNIVPGM